MSTTEADEELVLRGKRWPLVRWRLLNFGLVTLAIFNLSEQAFCQSVSDVSFQPTADNVVQISYRLSSSESTDFQVAIFASTDGGRNFFETRTVSGDVGHVSGTGWKSAAWDVLKDVDQFSGPMCKIKIQATEITSLSHAIGTYFTGSTSTKAFVNGFAVYGGWENITFTNTSFRDAIANGTLTNAGGWNAGLRYVGLPFILDGNYVNQTFRASGSRYPIIYQGVNVSLNFVLLPLLDYFDAYGGIGFQASELAMDAGNLKSKAQTNGGFWNAGAQINVMRNWRLGIQYSASVTSGKRNWKQLMLFGGYNFSTSSGAGK